MSKQQAAEVLQSRLAVGKREAACLAESMSAAEIERILKADKLTPIAAGQEAIDTVVACRTRLAQAAFANEFRAATRWALKHTLHLHRQTYPAKDR